jgi:hypothetical protein
MQPSALFIITSDPRVSPRPAEAIRVAAGTGVWGRMEVNVYLHGAAVLTIGETTDDLVDADVYTRDLGILAEFGRPVYVQEGAPLLAKIGTAPVSFEEVSLAQLAGLAAQSACVLRF